jgi:uncharacterized protein YggU (UPF0235/DUF167 family)
MFIAVRVIPRASRNLIKEENGVFKVYLTKPAQDNQANSQLICLSRLRRRIRACRWMNVKKKLLGGMSLNGHARHTMSGGITLDIEDVKGLIKVARACPWGCFPFSEYLKIKKYQIRIIKGYTCRNKLIQIDD